MLVDKNVVELLKNAIRKDGFIQLPAFGVSMFPLIQKDDLCTFERCEPNQLKKGQIILFYSPTGHLIAHRFFFTKKMKGIVHYVFKGDTNLDYDQPVLEDRLIGRLKIIEKQHSKIYVHKKWIVLWGKIMITFPFVSGILQNFLQKQQDIRQRIHY